MNDRVPKIDPASMKTEQGRQFAIELNQRLDSSRAQIRRLVKVLEEYWQFDDGIQLDLAEEAIIWSLATLASNERSNECEASFFHCVDAVYALTDHAKTTCDESSRERALADAIAAHEKVVHGLNEILAASAVKLCSRDKNDPVRLAAEFLHSTRTTFLNHAPRKLLAELIYRCVALSQAANSLALGIGSERNLLDAIMATSDVCQRIHGDVHDQIERGFLAVRDGQIVDCDEELDEDQ